MPDTATAFDAASRITSAHASICRSGEKCERLRAMGADAGLRLAASTDRGRILNPVIQPNPDTSGWRASFELAPEDNRAAELRATLLQGETPVSETWVYRWTA